MPRSDGYANDKSREKGKLDITALNETAKAIE